MALTLSRAYQHVRGVRKQQVSVVCMDARYANEQCCFGLPFICQWFESRLKAWVNVLHLAIVSAFRLFSLLLRTLRLSLIVVYASICFTIILSTIISGGLSFPLGSMSTSIGRLYFFFFRYLPTFLYFHSLFRLPFHSYLIAICRPLLSIGADHSWQSLKL